MKKFTKYKPFNPVPTINTPDPTFPRPLRPKLLTTTLQTTESFTTLPSSTTTRLILSDVAKWSFKLRCNETYKKTLASKESQDYKDFVNVVYYRVCCLIVSKIGSTCNNSHFVLNGDNNNTVKNDLKISSNECFKILILINRIL